MAALARGHRDISVGVVCRRFCTLSVVVEKPSLGIRTGVCAILCVSVPGTQYDTYGGIVALLVPIPVPVSYMPTPPATLDLPSKRGVCV